MITWHDSKIDPPPKDGAEILGLWLSGKQRHIEPAEWRQSILFPISRFPDFKWYFSNDASRIGDPHYWSELCDPTVEGIE